ncbi:MAG: ROK family protein [Thermoleophilaceae bacterium]
MSAVRRFLLARRRSTSPEFLPDRDNAPGTLARSPPAEQNAADGRIHLNVLGIDVGGTKVAVAQVADGAVTDSVEHPTALGSADELLAGIEAAVAELTARTGPPDAIGVGVPSQCEFATGRVVTSVNIPLAGVPLRERLGGALGAPVFVDNDANVAALAEAERGGVANLVMLTLGTGVGGGIVIGGRLFRGATGLGAELGHVVIHGDGPACPGSCPNRGCLEAFCSGTALERDATEAATDRPDSRLGRAAGEDGRVSGREAVAAAQEGDPEALRIFDELGRNLGIGIASMVNVFEPEQVLLGGGASRAADLFIERAKSEAAARALPALFANVEIALARGGADAGVLGAAALAAQEAERLETTPATPSEGNR